MENLDSENLDSLCDNVLGVDATFTIKIPTTQKELDRILSLKNNSEQLIQVDFDAVDMEESMDSLSLKVPTTQEKLDRIFNVA